MSPPVNVILSNPYHLLFLSNLSPTYIPSKSFSLLFLPNYYPPIINPNFYPIIIPPILTKISPPIYTHPFFPTPTKSVFPPIIAPIPIVSHSRYLNVPPVILSQLIRSYRQSISSPVQTNIYYLSLLFLPNHILLHPDHFLLTKGPECLKDISALFN